MTYVDVNGLATWHEVRGQGRPAVLLHGAFAGASSWAAQAPALAAAGYRAVVALLVARRRPDLVERLVLIGQYYNASGRVAGATPAVDWSVPGSGG